MADSRPVFFFDIDNTLYSKSKRIQNIMGDLIDQYFQTHLSLSEEDAFQLHMRYYKEYGLAIEGLVRHHKVDPLEYNSKVDDALPLENILHHDAELRELIESFDRSKVRLWLFTNAYVTHGKRVAKLVGVDDLFEGITYCDYGAERFVCKPNPEMFEKAKKDAGVSENDKCYFVGRLSCCNELTLDDSALNCRAAEALGWHSVHLVEPSDELPSEPASKHVVRSLQELRVVFPDLFKQP